MNLVISNHKNLWKKNEKNFLIGSWCLNQKNRFEEDKRKYLFQKYHWDNQSKLKKDLKYLYRVYYFFIKKLKFILNDYHKTNFSTRYYEILLSKWLWKFILFYFDRWEIIKDLKKSKKRLNCKVFPFDKKYFIPADSFDYCTSIIFSNDWNHWVFSEIISASTNIKITKFKNTNVIPTIKKTENKKAIFKSFSNKFLSPISSKEFFAQSMGFSGKAKLLFNSYYKQFRFFYPKKSNLILNSISLNIKDRITFLSKGNNRNKFINFLFAQLPYNFPQIFFENYKENIDNLKKLSFPKNPKKIMTAYDHHFNDLFNLYVAKNVDNHSKFYIFQHGGSYGVSDNYTPEYFDISVSDKFFSWGWKNNKKVVPFYLQKHFFAPEINHSDKKERIIIPTTEFYKCPVDIAGGRPRHKNELDSYIDNIVLFIKKLDNKNKKKISIKYLEERDTDYVRKSIYYANPKLEFLKSNKNTYQMNFKICVETLNSTGFLEGMHLNHPVILILDKKYSPIRKEAKKYFKLLHKMKIVHYSSESAANFINENFEDIFKWWNSLETQKARKAFCNKFDKKSNNIFLDIKKIAKY